MPAPRIVIVTPAPPGSRAGNRHTALRWARLLRGLGAQVNIRSDWDGGNEDLMIALHARKSRPAMLAWRACHGERPLILALTGTDLYQDIRSDAAARAALDLASRLVVLQAAALDELTPAQRSRCRVIHQSVALGRTELTTPTTKPPRRFRFCVLGHLRDEKDPFRAVLALQRLPNLPKQTGIEIVQAGSALSVAMAQEAHRLMAMEPRYRWVGELPHWRALNLLRCSHAMILSSRLEGGAHVVSEAIAAGVPVLASDIPGNRGLLGNDYPAYFPVGDEAALAELMRLTLEEPEFHATLADAVNSRRPLIDPQREAEAWRSLLGELLPGCLVAWLPAQCKLSSWNQCLK